MLKKRSGFLLAILLVAVAVLSLSFFAFRQEQASQRRCNNVVRRLKKGSPWNLSSSNEFPKQRAFFKKDRVFLNYHRNLNNYQCYNSQAFKYKISFKKNNFIFSLIDEGSDPQTKKFIIKSFSKNGYILSPVNQLARQVYGRIIMQRVD